MKILDLPGSRPEDIATNVALFTEKGGGTSQRPVWMIQRLTNLGNAGRNGQLDAWTPAFSDRSGINVNYSVNAVGKLLRMIVDASTGTETEHRRRRETG